MTPRRNRLLILLVLALSPMGGRAGTASAAPGDLDPTFSTDGRIWDEHPGFCKAVAVQSDGKIIAAGASGLGQGPYGDFQLVRYETDGSLDPTFGAGGVVTTDSGGANDNVSGMIVQPDGKILIGGLSDDAGTGEDSALVRYDADGSLDSDFGSGGMVQISHSPSHDHVEDVALQPDGKIVTAGMYYDLLTAQPQHIVLTRHHPDGTLDASFGDGGIVKTIYDVQNQDAALAVALQEDGKIVVAGQTGSPGPFDFIVLRYDTNGDLDAGFGSAGVVVTDFGGNETARSLFIQPDQKIVVGGYANGGSLGIRIARYEANGTWMERSGLVARCPSRCRRPRASSRWPWIRMAASSSPGRLESCPTRSWSSV